VADDSVSLGSGEGRKVRLLLSEGDREPVSRPDASSPLSSDVDSQAAEASVPRRVIRGAELRCVSTLDPRMNFLRLSRTALAVYGRGEGGAGVSAVGRGVIPSSEEERRGESDLSLRLMESTAVQRGELEELGVRVVVELVRFSASRKTSRGGGGTAALPL